MMRFLRPRYFFIGVIVGFALCSIAGFIVSQKARFNHFVRFFSYMSPTVDYYPTASELVATAKHDVDPNKILVLIGGSSVFRGDGQNEDELWSQKLQVILGNQYKVLNYGFNGARFPAFSGVAFRMLSERFPRIIFVSTCEFLGDKKQIDGGDFYGYLFWDAYYKGLFHPDKSEKQKISTLRKQQIFTEKGSEVHFMSFLDSFFYFRNLWNWVGYRFFFTVWNRNAYPATFQARRLFYDAKLDNKALVETARKNQQRFEREVSDLLKTAFTKKVDLSRRHYFKKEAEKVSMNYDIFESRYRANTLCVLATENPRHFSALPKIEQQAHEIAVNDTLSIIKSLGYYGVKTKDLQSDDYVDIEHFVATGGDKIAAQIAPLIKSIAQANHYDVSTTKS